jgi:MoaA/NifB/PqqE/SkfB family radical SAM enzyme
MQEELPNRPLQLPPSPTGCALPKGEIDNHSILVHRVGIETGKTCNLKCIYCFANSGKALPGELNISELFHVIDQASEVGAKIIPIVGGGEPTLSKHLIDIVAYISSKGLTPGVFTNCTVMTEELARRLFDLGAYVVGKLNSLHHDLEDFMTGVKGASKRIKQGIDMLMTAGFAEATPPRLSLNTIICKHNYDEVPAIFMWMRDRNIIPYIQMPVLVGRMKSGIAISNQQAKSLFYNLLKIDQETYGYDWIPVPPNISWPCTQRTTSCYITSKGDVQLCNSTNVCCGNVRTQRLRDILLSPQMQTIKDLKMIRGNCANCPYLGIYCCGGCTANSFTSTSDVFASDERCWHQG